MIFVIHFWCHIFRILQSASWFTYRTKFDTCFNNTIYSNDDITMSVDMFVWQNQNVCDTFEQKRQMFVWMLENINIKTNRKQKQCSIRNSFAYSAKFDACFRKCNFERFRIKSWCEQNLTRSRIYFDKIFVFQNWFRFCMKWAAISIQIECVSVDVLSLKAIVLKNFRLFSKIILRRNKYVKVDMFLSIQNHHMYRELKSLSMSQDFDNQCCLNKDRSVERFE